MCAHEIFTIHTDVINLEKIREITRFNQNLDERTYKNTLPMKMHFY